MTDDAATPAPEPKGEDPAPPPTAFDPEVVMSPLFSIRSLGPSDQTPQELFPEVEMSPLLSIRALAPWE